MTAADPFLMPVYSPLPARFVRGRGCWLWDEDGTRYLDAISGIAVCGLGHCHPEVTEALQAQAGELVHTSNLYHIAHQQELARRLCTATGMEQAFFGNSGAEACECALKIARLHGNRKGVDTPTVLVVDGAFHGRTLLTLSASDGERVRQGFGPLAEGFVRVAFHDLDAMRAAFEAHPDAVAVLIEPIQGEGGVRPVDSSYLAGLRALCDEREALLMLDEIQSGMGRTGTLFAYQAADILPDVCTVAKSLGNGYPIGACLVRGAARDVLQAGQHGSTFGGSPLACRVALAVLDVLERDDLAARAAHTGDILRTQLQERLLGRHGVVEVRGRGLMIGLELDAPAPDLAHRALTQQHLLVNVTRERVVRLLPPLVMDEEEAGLVCTRLEAALAA